MKEYEITMSTKEGRQYFEYTCTYPNRVKHVAYQMAQEKSVTVMKIREMGSGELPA